MSPQQYRLLISAVKNDDNWQTLHKTQIVFCRCITISGPINRVFHKKKGIIIHACYRNPDSYKICFYNTNLFCQIHFGGNITADRFTFTSSKFFQIK